MVRAWTSVMCAKPISRMASCVWAVSSSEANSVVLMIPLTDTACLSTPSPPDFACMAEDRPEVPAALLPPQRDLHALHSGELRNMMQWEVIESDCLTFFGCAGVPSSVRPLNVACSSSAGSPLAASSAAMTACAAAAAVAPASCGAYTNMQDSWTASIERPLNCHQASASRSGWLAHLSCGLLSFSLLAALLLTLSLRRSSTPCMMPSPIIG